MVRLKVAENAAEIIKIVAFQFQNGAIKSTLMLTSKQLIVSFNSKMVRLKVAPDVLVKYTLVSFQFQNGAIKRRF